MAKLTAADGEGFVFGRCGSVFVFPYGLAFVIEQHDAEAIEAAAHVSIRGEVPHDDAVHGFGGLQIDFPPRVIVGAGSVRDAAFRVIALGIAIDGALGGGIGVHAALCGDTGWPDVFTAAEHLDFGQLIFSLTGQFDVYAACWRCLFGVWRHHFRFDVGDDKVAEPGRGNRFDAERAEFVAGGGEFDGVAVFVAVFGDRNGTRPAR